MLSPWRHPDSGPVDANRFGSLPAWVKQSEPLTHDYHGNAPLYVLSQRGPLTFDNCDRGADRAGNGTVGEVSRGALHASPASGGLATALGALSRSQRFCWVAAAMSEGDRTVARRGVA